MLSIRKNKKWERNPWNSSIFDSSDADHHGGGVSAKRAGEAVRQGLEYSAPIHGS